MKLLLLSEFNQEFSNMKFSIGSQFSREFTFEESSITLRLTQEINEFFNNKNYGERIKKIYVGVICVSKGFGPFFVVRPLRILRKEPALEFELKLDYELFKNSDETERRDILIQELKNKTKEVLFEKTIKGFGTDIFIDDLHSFCKKVVEL
jgi:hypothetical protein